MSANGGGVNFGDLSKRVVSALAMAAVAFTAIWLGGVWFATLVGIASAVMTDEWRRIALGKGAWAIGLIQVAAVICGASLTYHGQPMMALAFLCVLSGMGAAADALSGRSALWGVTGALYIGMATIFLIGLRQNPDYGAIVVAFLVVSVAAVDVGAYFTGKTIGGPKLAPVISPNKTWSGLIGGICAAIVFGMAFVAIFDGRVSAHLAVALVLIAIAAQAGDLIESAYKRRFGVKDSGSLLPGHGGLLDRLDGLLAVTFVAMAMTLIRDGAPVHLW
ncbi:MAG: phosphatidate cytidylyltransferase [Pikeienuella sp.]